jgi:micrococcal nuclease
VRNARRRGCACKEVRRCTLAVYLAALASLAFGVSAHADPCKAIPDSGPAPAFLRPGRSFSGPVVRVIDGDSLCVAVGSGPAAWVEVRLADFYAAERGSPGGPAAKTALERIALGKVVSCTAGPQSYDRVVSACRISGRAIGEMMRAAGLSQGGRGYAPIQAPSLSRSSSTAEAREATAAESPYRSCRDARAAGAAPMYRGAPGYNPSLDGDHDGIACEPYRRH